MRTNVSSTPMLSKIVFTGKIGIDM